MKLQIAISLFSTAAGAAVSASVSCELPCNCLRLADIIVLVLMCYMLCLERKLFTHCLLLFLNY